MQRFHPRQERFHLTVHMKNIFPGCSSPFPILPLLCSFLRNRWRRRPGVPRSAIHFRFHHLRRSTHTTKPSPYSTLQSDPKSNFLLCASCLNIDSYLFTRLLFLEFSFYFLWDPPFLCMSCLLLFPNYAVPFLTLSSDLAFT